MEPDSDSDVEGAITKQYQEEVKDDSSSGEEDADDSNPEKKKLVKEKVRITLFIYGSVEDQRLYTV